MWTASIPNRCWPGMTANHYPTPNLVTEQLTGAAFASPFKFTRYGQSGIPINDMFPHLGQHADDLCVVRSMSRSAKPRAVAHADERQRPCAGPPSLGSWLTYGLGTEINLPGFIAMCPGGRQSGPATRDPRRRLRAAWTPHQKINQLIQHRIRRLVDQRQLDLCSRSTAGARSGGDPPGAHPGTEQALVQMEALAFGVDRSRIGAEQAANSVVPVADGAAFDRRGVGVLVGTANPATAGQPR